MKKFNLINGGEVAIDRESIDSVQTRHGGGLVIRTKQGGVFAVVGDLSEVLAWASKEKVKP